MLVKGERRGEGEVQSMVGMLGMRGRVSQRGSMGGERLLSGDKDR